MITVMSNPVSYPSQQCHNITSSSCIRAKYAAYTYTIYKQSYGPIGCGYLIPRGLQKGGRTFVAIVGEYFILKRVKFQS